MSQRSKYFQDPLYGQVAVSSPKLLGLIDSRPVQRLRNIRQLGTSYLTFLGAEHSRFSHSLGCMVLMDRVLAHLQAEEGLRLSPRGRELAMAAALLHDIGHCAFSHTLESVLAHHHEAMTARLLREDPQLKRLLGPARLGLADLFEGKAPRGELKVVKDLLSSQLDVDRLDYLVRDAHYTGVNSGQVDLARIIASFTVNKGGLAVKARGLLAVEEYFLARYFMYWKVYYHKTSRGFELILKAILRRAKALQEKGRLGKDGLTAALSSFLSQGLKVPLHAFLDHDDHDVMVAMKSWALHADPLLARLSASYLGREKVSLVLEASNLEQDLTPKKRKEIIAYFERREPGSAEAYFIEDRLGGAPYDASEPVWVVQDDGQAQELSRVSKVVNGIASQGLHARYYVPPEHAKAVAAILRTRS